jgi:hypothetical protein
MQMNLHYHKVNLFNLTHKKTIYQDSLCMRRLKFITRQTPCMTAALLLALLPVFHGLHLASCKRKQPSFNAHPMKHVHCGYGFPHHNEHASNGSACCRAEISSSRNVGGQRHDPSTCLFCRFFTQLMHAGWFNSSQLIQLPEEIHIWVPCPDRVVLKIYSFSRGCPRAPPV